MTVTLKGQCLCRGVSVEASATKHNAGACHCNMCRRWGGGPFMTVDCGSDVSFYGVDNIQEFASSDWAARGFCKQCGTHLFYHLKGNDQYFMPAGLFDGEDNYVFDHQVFIDEKPGYYQFANDTHNMTGAELFAAFAPPENE